MTLPWDRALLALGGGLVTVLVLFELWVEMTGAILAYTVAAMLLGEHHQDQARRASTYNRSVSTSTPP